MHLFLKSFYYAFKGIRHGFLTERNFRFHVLAIIVVTTAGLVTGLSAIEWCIIFIMFGWVTALELINTAIERTIDLVTEEIHPLAGQAKDLASGAVLIFAFFSAIIGLIIFIPKWFS
ncbi:diacylglycerol kinase family protein [Sporosarcina luteola]|uniref:diacylglycerol kinase family protein n=1 Tax=Sporosarcina luteola TaxID=582850 RepID=UPI002040BE2A|nr:diacylglycerol kinase family protein [Sporosarcina luteola]MCM3710857.1 diacylglycerol kinase family protein [Sporosarcina luteola]MCM3743387.1 diacylglycerol kinase family protein [Sporosarcina luteola]